MAQEIEKNDSVPDACYARTYITDVIARVDFVDAIADIDKRLPAGLRNRVLRDYPVEEPRQVQNVEFTMDASGEVTKNQTTFFEWRFHQPDTRNFLVIGRKALAFNWRTYAGYGGVRAQFDGLATELLDELGVSQISRTGLRYINQVTAGVDGPLHWQTYIQPELLGLLSYSLNGEKLTRVFSTIEMMYSDFYIRFQFGLHNPDHPAPIVKRNFILDYDAYSRGAADAADLTTQLDAYHRAVKMMFERSITDELRREMDNVSGSR